MTLFLGVTAGTRVLMCTPVKIQRASMGGRAGRSPGKVSWLGLARPPVGFPGANGPRPRGHMRLRGPVWSSLPGRRRSILSRVEAGFVRPQPVPLQDRTFETDTISRRNSIPRTFRFMNMQHFFLRSSVVFPIYFREQLEF